MNIYPPHLGGVNCDKQSLPELKRIIIVSHQNFTLLKKKIRTYIHNFVNIYHFKLVCDVIGVRQYLPFQKGKMIVSHLLTPFKKCGHRFNLNFTYYNFLLTLIDIIC